MKRLLRRILPGVLALLLLVLAALGWLAGTESGLQFLWRRVIAPAVPELAIDRLEGRLAGPLRLAGLRYANARFLFAAHTLELDWSMAALRDRVFRVERLAGTGVRYEQRTAGEDGGPLRLPARLALPLAIELVELAVQELAIVGTPGAEPLVFDSVALAGSYRATALAVTRLAVHHPAFGVDGTFGVQTRDEFPVTGVLHWQATPPGYAPVEAQAALSGSLQALHVEQVTAAPYGLRLDLTLNEPLAELRLDGGVLLEDSDLAAVNAAWPDMRLTGRITARGPVTALALDGALDVQDPRAGALHLVLAGTLLPDALQFDTLRLAAAEGPTRLEAQGRIGFGAQPVFDFEAQWQALAWPLTGPPDYASRKGRFSLAGTPDAYRLDAAGDLRIRDLLAGDLALRAHSADTPGNWRIETARLAAGDARIEASGQAGAVFDLAWRVAAPRLGDLVPQATGRLEASGTLGGTLPEPALALQATGAGLAWREYRLGTLAVDAGLDLAAGRRSRLEAALGDARLPGVAIRRADLRGAGTTARHQARVEAETDQGSAMFELTGRWDGATWRYELGAAELTRPPLAPWRLAGPVGGELTQTRFTLPEHCWTSGRARACGRIRRDAGAFDAAFTLADLPLDYFAAYIPGGVGLQGELRGQGEFARPVGQAPVASVRLDSTPLQLGLPDDAGAAQRTFSFAPAQAAFTLQRERAVLEVDLPFADAQGGVRARAGLAQPVDGDWLNARLTGELALEWPDIGLASRWIPEVAELGGRIDGRLQFDGTPAAPRLQGRLALSEGTAMLVTPGLLLSDVRLELAGQPAGDIRITAAAVSGGGTLRGDGFANPGARTANLVLRGEQVQVMNTPEAKIFASPDLQLAVDSTQATLTGRIDIPRAQLRPRKPPPSAVSVSADQVIVVEGGQAEAAARYPVTARVRIVLGDAVDIDGLGLSGRLRGDVRVTDPPGQPATASGELSIVDGRYEAYGQDLEIRTGRLLYAGGAVTAPGLDIEAVRRPAPDLVVGVRARGQLRAPTFTVFSEPSMPQSQQLSWLVLGRPLEGGTSDSERSAMQAAALMLGLSGGDAIGKRVGESLGLDEVTVGTDPGEGVTQASLLVGKYLTPELFVSYGIGLFEPVATLRLRYALSSRWKMVGQAAAAGSSADLFYEIERRR